MSWCRGHLEPEAFSYKSSTKGGSQGQQEQPPHPVQLGPARVRRLHQGGTNQARFLQLGGSDTALPGQLCRGTRRCLCYFPSQPQTTPRPGAHSTAGAEPALKGQACSLGCFQRAGGALSHSSLQTSHWPQPQCTQQPLVPAAPGTPKPLSAPKSLPQLLAAEPGQSWTWEQAASLTQQPRRGPTRQLQPREAGPGPGQRAWESDSRLQGGQSRAGTRRCS